MKILVIGSGGREHAIVHKLSQSQYNPELFCAPGNGGISQLATCVPIGATDINGLVDFAKDKTIDLTIVGMDDPLMLGVVDAFEEAGLAVFGPRKNAAIIEGSKSFSKDLMQKYDIPTAGYAVFDKVDEAIAYVGQQTYPLVLKADGLALGKGVLICETKEEALEGLQTIMVDHKFGDAGQRVVVEEFMEGPEVSVLAFCDGKTVLPMVSAQDHKRAFDGDEGPNTGGMGTFSPSRYYTKEVQDFCESSIFQQTLDAMAKEGRPFTGILFFGLMLTEDGPKVLEYNARFGDPEAQVVLPRMKNDLVDVVQKALLGELDQVTLEWEDGATVCVVLASGGYPVAYEKGKVIHGLAEIGGSDVMVYHAGTAKQEEAYVTNGGRVLGVTAKGATMEDARKKAYDAVNGIEFEGKQYRNDIGIK